MTATAHSIGAAVGFALVLTLCMRLLRQIKYEGAPRVEAPTWGDDLGCVLATALLTAKLRAEDEPPALPPSSSLMARPPPVMNRLSSRPGWAGMATKRSREPFNELVTTAPAR